MMTDKIVPKKSLAILIFIATIFMAACNLSTEGFFLPGGSSSPTKVQPGAYPIDPLFEDFYTYLGGSQTLGPAISPLKEIDGLKRQYVESGLMVYDPSAPSSDRFRLAPLGLNLEVAEPAVPKPQEPGVRYIAGHIIDPDFLPLYEALGGARFVGCPITEARHNPDRMRIEQYFENLGFYRLVEDESSQAHLLAYGVIACDRNCRYQSPLHGIPERRPPLPEPFASRQSILGLPFVGLTLSEPYEAPDGKWEVIFENLVLAADSQGSANVSPRPIVELVGIPAQPMSPCPQDDPLVDCLPGVSGQGYSVPVYFRDYVLQHGGWELFGMPISEVYVVGEGVFRQCFTNLCVDFNLTQAGGPRLQPVPLGGIYKDLFYDRYREKEFEEDFQGLHLVVSEGQPRVASGQPQQIRVTISEEEAPLANREPFLTLTYPDGSQGTFHLPPTDSKGRSSIQLPAIDAPNGTLIPYQVCLVGIEGKTFCLGDHYLIWNLR